MIGFSTDIFEAALISDRQQVKEIKDQI